MKEFFTNTTTRKVNRMTEEKGCFAGHQMRTQGVLDQQTILKERSFALIPNIPTQTNVVCPYRFKRLCFSFSDLGH